MLNKPRQSLSIHGSPVACRGCGDVFLNKSKRWREHYATCHAPAVEREREEAEKREREEEFEDDVCSLVDAELTDEQARAIVELIHKYK